MEGAPNGVLGHISVRAGDDQMLIRGRGPRDHGLPFTAQEDIRLVDFSGSRAWPGRAPRPRRAALRLLLWLTSGLGRRHGRTRP